MVHIILALAQLDDEDRIKYIKSMNTERDTYNQIEYARESGREEERLKIAMNLICAGASCEIIALATGLSAEEVSRLKEKSDTSNLA